VDIGPKMRISSGLDWVFQEVEEAIILEADCLPDPSFFWYCQELLERYRHDTRVGIISGDNFLFNKQFTEDSYYFSAHLNLWGWATWRRVWKYYDVNMSDWPDFKKKGYLRKIFSADKFSDKYIAYLTQVFDNTYEGKVDTWDYQVVLTCLSQGFLAITPAVNLVSNIGFGPLATHTVQMSPLANVPVESINFPLSHPKIFVRNIEAECYFNKKFGFG